MTKKSHRVMPAVVYLWGDIRLPVWFGIDNIRTRIGNETDDKATMKFLLIIYRVPLSIMLKG
jgi:hypothetical protein